METSFGRNLKNLRKERKLSQKGLAEKLKVSWHTVSHWETGYSEPSIEQIKLLAKFFEVTADDLLSDE